MQDEKLISNKDTYDNWIVQIDQIILNIVTNNPQIWFLFYKIISSGIVLLAICLFILIKSDYISLSDENFYYPLLISFCFFSFLPGTIGGVRILIIHSSLKIETSLEKIKEIANYFKVLWIIGIIQFPFVYIIAGLGHLDCGQDCVASVGASDLASNISFLVWVIVPFYFWYKSRRIVKFEEMKHKQDAPKNY